MYASMPQTLTLVWSNSKPRTAISPIKCRPTRLATATCSPPSKPCSVDIEKLVEKIERLNRLRPSGVGVVDTLVDFYLNGRGHPLKDSQ